MFLCFSIVCLMFMTVITAFSPQDGRTALMRASIKGHTDVVQPLLSIGAQVDLKDKVRQHQLVTEVFIHPY